MTFFKTILVILVLILLGSGLFFYNQKFNNPPSNINENTQSNQQQTAWKKIVDTKLGYQIQYPDNWVPRNRTQKIDEAKKQRNLTPGEALIVQNPETLSSITFNEYCDQSVEDTQGVLEQETIKSVITLGGRSGIEYSVNFAKEPYAGSPGNILIDLKSNDTDFCIGIYPNHETAGPDFEVLYKILQTLQFQL